MRRPRGPAWTHDLFVSYRHEEPDASWVTKRFVPALCAQEMSVFLDHGDFRLGPPVMPNMELGVEASRFTVAVRTSRYLRSTFTAAEFEMAYRLGLVESQPRLIVVLREALPPLDLGLPSVDMIDDARFDDGIAEIQRMVRSPFPRWARP